MLMPVLLLLTACFPAIPPPVDPLNGITNWEQLPEAKSSQNRFSRSSLGIMLSDNVEQQIKAYREYMTPFARGMNSKKVADDFDFISGAREMVSMLRRNFRKLTVSNDLNECLADKLDYCAVIDWQREMGGGPSYSTTLKLFLLNSKAERIAVLNENSGWHSNGFFDDVTEGLEMSEKDVISKLEKKLQLISR